MRRWQYLDSWNQGKISNQDDAQLSGHVLHDRPALITKTCTQTRETRICDGRSKKKVSHIGFTLSDAEFDLQVDGSGHHRLGEDQDVLQTDHHHQVREDLPREVEEKGLDMIFEN